MMGSAEIIRASPAEACRPTPRHVLDIDGWSAMVAGLAETRLDLLALWADTQQVHALFQDPAAGELLFASVPVVDGHYPAVSPWRPGAVLFERMVHDLWGHVADGAVDLRPWLDHGRWDNVAPMSPRSMPRTELVEPPEFFAPGGQGLHQIAVGPVHAGIIEPGHFRLTVQGEALARLEVRLGYAHKGTLLLLRGKTPRSAARFAARLSGDSTVAHSIAFARAAEAATDAEAPPRAHALRAVMAEMERIANHLLDIGAITNDAAWAIGPARFGVLREAMLQAAQAAFGHRLMMDAVIPGGVAADIAASGSTAIKAALDAVAAGTAALMRLYDTTPSLADRMATTGCVTPEFAAAYAAGGIVGRASGAARDLRRLPSYPPYDTLAAAVPRLRAGDVDARVRLRAAEVVESTRLLRTLLATLPDGEISVALPMAGGEGLGWAEGPRGDIWHWLRLDGGLIASAFLRDPSWLHWPLLEAAMEGVIVADFPLVNRSINGSYSGVDL